MRYSAGDRLHFAVLAVLHHKFGRILESISWAQGESGGPFIFALIFILVAIVPLVMLFIPRVNSKQLYSSASLVTAAGVVIIGNVVYNWGPKELDDLDLDSL